MEASREHLERIQRDPLVRWLARLGYGARGVVYGIVGFFALAASYGSAQPTSARGALRTLLHQPLGEVLLALVGVGLIGYSLWRLVQAVRDVDGHGTSARGLAIRAGLLVSGVSYGMLAWFAFNLLLIPGGSGGRDLTATLMAQPFGRWLVGLVGAAIIGAGIAQAIKAWRRRYRRYLQVAPAQWRWVDPVSRYGLLARGAVFVMIGGFFILAAIQSQAREAAGLAEALSRLQAQPHGAVLLGIVAAGLAAFAVYSLIEAVYRRLG